MLVSLPLLLTPLAAGAPVSDAPPPAVSSASAQGKTVQRDGETGARGRTKGKTGKRGKAGKKKGPKLVGPFRKGAYPRQERLRPLVLPGGMVEGELSGGALDSGDGLSGNVGVRGAIGLGDTLELAVGTGVVLTPEFGWNQTVAIDVAFLAVDGKTFDMAPGLSVPLQFADGAGFQVAVDLTSRILPARKVFVYFGNDAIPITLTPDVELALVANGGAGLQVSQGTAVMVDTTLVSLGVLPTTSVTGLWDTLVVNGAVQHSPNKTTDLGLRATVKNPWNQTDPASWGGTAYAALRF